MIISDDVSVLMIISDDVSVLMNISDDVPVLAMRLLMMFRC
jgi:hypothetical protein